MYKSIANHECIRPKSLSIAELPVAEPVEAPILPKRRSVERTLSVGDSEKKGKSQISSVESDFLKEIKLRYIPRYLIFDKNGRLVDLDAPRPSSKEAEKKLNQVNLRKST